MSQKLKATYVTSSMTPAEYEIFYIIASLTATGEKEVTFSRIHQELNRQRNKQQKTLDSQARLPSKHVSKQAMNHHLAKLSTKPFMQKRSQRKNTLYSLKNGLYKLRQTPPLCISITNEKTKVMICNLITQCKLAPLSSGCLEKLAPTPQVA